MPEKIEHIEEEKSFDEMTFSEALANTANRDKSDLVLQLMSQFRKGEPGAIKVVTNAILEHQYNEENKFPIEDDRFKTIIQLAATAISQGEI